MGGMNNLKYSIIMPYCGKSKLRFTLDSYVEYYKDRDDVEVIIVEDSKNREEFRDILKQYNTRIPIITIKDPKKSNSSSSKYNRGVGIASGSIIMLTNPNTPHNFDFLEKIDEIDLNNKYLILACARVDILNDRGTFFNSDIGFRAWYQHSIHKNTMYHFCSVISKKNYEKVGGLSEKSTSVNEDFLREIKRNDIVVETNDDMYTYLISDTMDNSLDLSRVYNKKGSRGVLYQNIDGYGSHLTVIEELKKIINFKTILEFGGGDFSTKYFKANNLSVTTIESQYEEWFKKLKEINSDTFWIPDHNKVIEYAQGYKGPVDIVFLDTHQDLRYKLVPIVLKYTDHVILHDSETSLYKYHEIDTTGLYCAEFVLHRPWTMVISKSKKVVNTLVNKLPGIKYSPTDSKLYLADI